MSAGVRNIRAGSGHQKNLIFFSKKISQCRKMSHSAKNTLFLILIHASPILIHWFGFRLHILLHALPILIDWVDFRLSVPYLNTLPTRQHPRLSAKTYITSAESSANQSRALHHPGRQPIRVELYVTPENSRRLDDPSRLSARVGSL